MSIREGVWKSLVWAARILLYPVHSAFRILARLVLIAAAITPLVGLVLLGWSFWEEILDCARALAEGTVLLIAVSFLIAVGLFVVILRAMGQLVLVAFKLVGKTVMDALRGNWHPGWAIIRSFVETWHEYVVEVPGTIFRTFGSACLLALVVFGVGVLAWAAYPLTKPKMVDRYIVVVDANEDRGGKTVKEEIKYHLSTRTIFSLTYLNDAQPQVGEGICLEEGHKEWLRMFKEAIVECIQLERSRTSEAAKQGVTSKRHMPTFEVVGFASIAPMQSGDQDGAVLNCEVANRRADAVGSFLADEGKYKDKWNCGTIGKDFSLTRNLCTGTAEVYEESSEDITYRVRVRKWSDPEQMQGKKPADDGAVPNERRYRVELLNRAVHVTVPENFCQVLDSNAGEDGGAANSSDAPNGAEAGATSTGNESALGGM